MCTAVPGRDRGLRRFMINSPCPDTGLLPWGAGPTCGWIRPAVDENDLKSPSEGFQGTWGTRGPRRLGREQREGGRRKRMRDGEMSPEGGPRVRQPAGTQPPRPARASVQPSLPASAFPVSASLAASWLRTAEQRQMDSSQLTWKAGLGHVLSHLPSNSVCLRTSLWELSQTELLSRARRDL